MNVIDDHLAQVGPAERPALERLRHIILDIIPAAEEVISYGMPGFKYKGKYVCGFDAFKDHLSFFPTSAAEAFAAQLTDFKTSKGTIQFSADHPIPEQLIRDIINYRIAAINQST